MEKFAWKGKIKKGMLDEYKKRHDEIWEEMKQVLKDAGIINYSIWTDGENLFGYYECKKGIDHAVKTQINSTVVKEWEAYMQDILIFENLSKEESQPTLKKVFEFD